MKLITAIVRPDKLDELIGTLVDNQAHGLTVTEVRGFGRQFGQLAAGAGAGLSRVTLLHKIRLDVVALDDDVETLVEAIAKHARTETVGDGKIWVTPVDSALRVRTGERDRAAIKAVCTASSRLPSLMRGPRSPAGKSRDQGPGGP
jgi:nitrogen regulatory protein PII